MRALSSTQIGDVFTALRDRLPKQAREVRLAVKLRTDYDGPIKRPSRKLPKLQRPAKSEAVLHAEAQRAILKDILRGSHFSKFGTSPKLRVRRPEPEPVIVERPPVLLLTDQRSDRRKRLARIEKLGPVPNPIHSQRIAQINAAMAVQFGPWPRRIHVLAYEVIHV